MKITEYEHMKQKTSHLFDRDQPLVSIAISLKRIADMMKQKMEKEYPYSHGHRVDEGEMPF